MAARACPGAAGALGRAVRACFGAANALKMAAQASPGAASALEKANLACCGAASALKMAVLTYSGAARMRLKSVFKPASVPPVRSKTLFEPAVRDHYSKVLVSVSLCSEPLHSALLYSVHGYARVHTSIYTYTSVDPCMSMHRAKQSRVQWLRARCNRDQHFRIVISNSRLGQPPCAHWRH